MNDMCKGLNVSPSKKQEDATEVVGRVVNFLQITASSEDNVLHAAALEYAANQIQEELDIDDGDLAFLPE